MASSRTEAEAVGGPGQAAAHHTPTPEERRAAELSKVERFFEKPKFERAGKNGNHAASAPGSAVVVPKPSVLDEAVKKLGKEGRGKIVLRSGNEVGEVGKRLLTTPCMKTFFVDGRACKRAGRDNHAHHCAELDQYHEGRHECKWCGETGPMNKMKRL